jgi:hypothetical protein
MFQRPLAQASGDGGGDTARRDLGTPLMVFAVGADRLSFNVAIFLRYWVTKSKPLE